MQGQEKNVLHRESVFVFSIELSPTLGLSDTDPVRCTITGTPETRLLDKGLQEDRHIAVPLLSCPGSNIGSALTPSQTRRRPVAYTSKPMDLTATVQNQ